MKSIKHISIAAAIVLLMAACTKEVVGVSGRVIGEQYVSAEEGEFPIIVSMNTVWTAQTMEDWLSISEDCEGYIQGDYAVTVRYTSNQSTESRRNFNRLGHVIIRSYDGFKADTVLVKQRGLDPFVELQSAVVEGTECQVKLNTNLTDEQRPNIVCKADDSWVRSVAMNDAKTALNITLAPNDSGAERTTIIRFVFTDAWGQGTEENCSLTQK